MKNECFQKGFWWFYDKIQKVSTIKTQQSFYLGNGQDNLDFDDGKYNLENWTAGQQIIYLVSGPNCLGGVGYIGGTWSLIGQASYFWLQAFNTNQVSIWWILDRFQKHAVNDFTYREPEIALTWDLARVIFKDINVVSHLIYLISHLRNSKNAQSPLLSVTFSFPQGIEMHLFFLWLFFSPYCTMEMSTVD